MALYQVQAQFHGIRANISARRIPLGMKVMGTFWSMDAAIASKSQHDRELETPDGWRHVSSGFVLSKDDAISIIIVSIE